MPYRFGLDGSVERLVERDDAVCTWLALGGGRLATIASVEGGACDVYAVEDGDLRRLSRNGGSLVRAVPPRPGAPRRAAPRRTRHRRVGRPPARPAQQGPRPPDPRRPALRARPVAVAGDGRARGRRASPCCTATRAARSGYGETFAKAIEGNWGEADDSDLMRLVDWAIRQKLGTRDHVGLLGLSYGGYMTNWLLGHHPGRFAAAVSENPVARPVLVLRRVRLRLHDRPARGWRRRAVGRLPADAREVAGRRCSTATRRRCSCSRPKATSAAPRVRPRSRSPCSAASAARSRWCATRTSST